MKLLFIFTGGTIGSTQSGDFISVDKNKSYLIIESYRKHYEIDFEYKTICLEYYKQGERVEHQSLKF